MVGWAFHADDSITSGRAYLHQPLHSAGLFGDARGLVIEDSDEFRADIFSSFRVGDSRKLLKNARWHRPRRYSNPTFRADSLQFEIHFCAGRRC